MQERRLKLTPINPFSPRQGQIIELRANGLTNQEVAKKLKIARWTVNNHIANDPYSIFARIENITGIRPAPRNWIAPLIGDVLLFQDKKQ
ncbi:hypothetical protein KA005_33030 [bacterium]|nr:hypothetical protein [bacterium]